MNALTESLRARGVLAKVLIAFAAIYFIWGSTFLAIRVAIDGLPPLMMCAARLLSAGAILVAWARARGDAWPAGIEWRNAAIVGVLLPAVGNGAVTVGETRIASGLVALLVASIPLWMALLTAIGPGRERPRGLAVTGLLAGFGGIALLIGPGLGAGPGGVSPTWALIPVAGAFSWAWGSLWSRRARLPRSPIMSTGVGLLAGGVLLALASVPAGEWARFDPRRVTAASLAATAYLSVFGSVVGFSAYLYLLRTVSPGVVATYAFVNPVVALLLGTLAGGEPLTRRTLLAAAMVIASVVLITTARARRSQPVTTMRAEVRPQPEASRAK